MLHILSDLAYYQWQWKGESEKSHGMHSHFMHLIDHYEEPKGCVSFVKAAKSLIIIKATFHIRLIWTIVYINNRPDVHCYHSDVLLAQFAVCNCAR